MAPLNLRTLDLNLLLVFDAVLAERSVIRAAARLGLSQPATSHALNRLRTRLGDQLFVRASGGMTPTPRAEQMATPVRRALEDLQAVLEPDSFTPATSERRFVVAVNNYAAVVLGPALIVRCRVAAPNVRLVLRPVGDLSVTERLEAGDLDLAITTEAVIGEGFASQTIIQDRYVAVVRRGHPASRGGFSITDFAGLARLAISASGEDTGFVETALAERGLAPRIGAEAPYLSVGALLADSDMVAVLGRRIAEEFRRSHPVEVRDLPFVSSALNSVMLWRRRLDDQPAHRWLRTIVAATAASA